MHRRDNKPIKPRAYVKAWQDVINSVTGKVHDEEGLWALDAIHYGPLKKVDSITAEVAEEMINEFERLYPEFKYDHLEIHTEE